MSQLRQNAPKQHIQIIFVDTLKFLAVDLDFMSYKDSW